MNLFRKFVTREEVTPDFGIGGLNETKYMENYKKPINKNTLTVRFVAGKFENTMELPSIPREGEYFNDPNQDMWKITKVIYVPFNQFMDDIKIEGELVRNDALQLA